MLQTENEILRCDQAAGGAACRTVYTTAGTQWLEPVQISAQTIVRMATSDQTLGEIRQMMDRLTDDDYLQFLKGYYDTGRANFGRDWHYADLLTFLHASAKLLRPRRYLEIGVRRGRSLAVVSSVAPECAITGFDLWMENYAGMPNPGADFVSEELSNLGHRGSLQLISGNSHETVPQFFADHPGYQFDLINVDGDHSEDGAQADLETVLPRLAVGGVIVLDDITHPQHRYLEQVWDRVVGNNPDFSSAKYRELGYGVAVAVRKQG
ncbi:class I SAM-dependent methyltransferase [Roseiconus lacunae]|uniref:Class I SAM-dependent methyltransferase n=1 Tax=Roseiconus lacunae TaxID=2605694 RepID=A0ABT7PQ36_9BACT|nr:class I SAM-dependent methyltransferase [Roseiconus lacunae]MCD0461877.1 class I SAM-dependent methyltransferase [Roseiconus lacunae]MDM4018588.1 class I SAM-dependent methyltransferase [Roseiconus lacunae]WRQ52642.1 class I SAM-dependent methyltransferase [Stieleria sp. HD01]